MPTTINGTAHPSNKACIDWSEKGLIAFATHSVVTIIDPWTTARIQVLELHSAAICELHWSPSRRFNDDGEDSRLASADISGEIVVCEAISAAPLARLKIAGCSVLAHCWFAWKDTPRDFILSLHSQGQLVLWNTDSATKVWQHTYSAPHTGFVVDPFDAGRLCFFTPSDSTLTLSSDISLNAQPISNGRSITLLDKSASLVTTAAFHRAYRGQLYAVTENTLFIIDAEVAVILSRAPLDALPLALLPAASRDALYVVNASGSVSLRVGLSSSEAVVTEQVCVADTGRKSGQKRPIAAALCPSTDAAVAVLYGNGKCGIFQLASTRTDALPYRAYTIDDVLEFGTDLKTTPTPGARLQLSSLVPSISSGATLLRVRPLSTEEGDPFAGLQLAAVGTQHGQVHIVDLFTARVLKELHVQNSQIKCLEWAGPHSLISTGYNHTLSSTNLVRNDVFLTDARTGVARRIRQEKDESALVLMRLSYYYCYMALAFQSDPLEIWDLKTLRMLRRMSKTCPIIVDMAWSSKHHGIKQTETLSVYRENLVVLDSENRLYHVVVKGLHVRDGKEVNTQWRGGGWQLRSMAWKEDLLALGDADGRVVLWDLAKRRSTEARHSKTPCIRMAFSRVAHDYTLVVLHPREVHVWDAERMVLQTSVALDTHKAVLDVELCGLTLFAICADNCVRVASATDVNRPLPDHDIPLLLRSTASSGRRGASADPATGDADGGRRKSSSSIADRSSSPITAWESTPKERGSVPARGALAALCALSAKMNGASDVKREAALQRFLGHAAASQLLVMLEASTTPSAQLPPNLELHWPNATYKTRHSAICSLLCRVSASAPDCIEEAVVMGGSSLEAAVDSLVASPQDLLVSSLRAAVLVSEQRSEHSRSLIKLIATNLIASDHMSDGVQLLFLVGAGADACKYLASQRLWHRSVRYAKLGLSPEAARDVHTKWIAHLSMDERTLSILALAASGEWQRVAIHLRGMRQERVADAVEAAAPPPKEEATVE